MDIWQILIPAIASLVSALGGIFFYQRYQVRKNHRVSMAEIITTAEKDNRQMTLTEMQYIITHLKEEREECDKKYEQLHSDHISLREEFSKLRLLVEGRGEEIADLKKELARYKNEF